MIGDHGLFPAGRGRESAARVGQPLDEIRRRRRRRSSRRRRSRSDRTAHDRGTDTRSRRRRHARDTGGTAARAARAVRCPSRRNSRPIVRAEDGLIGRHPAEARLSPQARRPHRTPILPTATAQPARCPNSRTWHCLAPRELLRGIFRVAERRPRDGGEWGACADRRRCRTTAAESDGRTATSTARPALARRRRDIPGMTRRRISSSTSRSSQLVLLREVRAACAISRRTRASLSR